MFYLLRKTEYGLLKKKANALDLIKTISCVLIVGSHCLPIFVNENANYYFGQWFFRFCVPLFFISTGYFFSKMEKPNRYNYIIRIGALYCLSTLLYIPYVMLGGLFHAIGYFIFGWHHLWYLSSLFFGLIGYVFLDRLIPKAKIFLVLTLIGGILLNVYFKLFDLLFLNYLADIVSHFGGARHAFFFALPLLLIGECIGKKEWNRRNKYYVLWCLIFFALGFIETTFLKSKLGMDIRLDITIFGWMPAVPLFIIGLTNQIPLKPADSRCLRKATDIVYIIHIWVFFFVNKTLGIDLGLGFVTVTVVSYALATVIILVKNIIALKDHAIAETK
jgi:surface polysaccharide O-acyltransferase-like enzyme